MLVIQSQAELLDILDKRIHTLKMRGAITGHKRTMSEVRIDHALVADWNTKLGREVFEY
jgi:hypothetical protein